MVSVVIINDTPHQWLTPLLLTQRKPLPVFSIQVTDIEHKANKEINSCASCCHLKVNTLQGHKRLSRAANSLWIIIFLPFVFVKKRQRAVSLHSKRSARVLVRRATGRLVLSLVMAKSCMPNSSATLACVRLFTSELRSNYGHTQTHAVRERERELHSMSSCRYATRIATQSHDRMDIHRSYKKIKNNPQRGIIHQRQEW